MVPVNSVLLLAIAFSCLASKMRTYITSKLVPPPCTHLVSFDALTLPVQVTTKFTKEGNKTVYVYHHTDPALRDRTAAPLAAPAAPSAGEEPKLA